MQRLSKTRTAGSASIDKGNSSLLVASVDTACQTWLLHVQVIYPLPSFWALQHVLQTVASSLKFALTFARPANSRPFTQCTLAPQCSDAGVHTVFCPMWITQVHEHAKMSCKSYTPHHFWGTGATFMTPSSTYFALCL